MAKPVDKPIERETDEPEFVIYEEDFEESSRDPRVRRSSRSPTGAVQASRVEGRIIYYEAGRRLIQSLVEAFEVDSSGGATSRNP